MADFRIKILEDGVAVEDMGVDEVAVKSIQKALAIYFQGGRRSRPQGIGPAVKILRNEVAKLRKEIEAGGAGVDALWQRVADLELAVRILS